MLQGWAMARLYVENFGLTKNKEIRNPLQNKTKHQTKIKNRLFIFLIEKEFFLHCIYKDHSDVDNSNGAKLFIIYFSCL